MRICIITSSFPSGPADIVQAPFLIEFIDGLKRRGHRAFVFTQDRKGEKQEFLEGVKVKWFPWMGSRRPLVHLNVFSPLDCLRLVSLIRRGKEALPPYLEENEIEACLALWVFPAGYFANQAFRKTGVPYSVWALGSDIYRYSKNPFLYGVMNRIIAEARAVFSDGFDLAKRIEERFHRKASFLATTRVLSGRPLPQPAPSLYRFLFVGRLEKVKGIDVLIQAMALLKEEGLEPDLTIIGRGSLEGWAKAYIERKALGPQVSMVGNVADSTLVSYYGSSSCVLIPSRSESIPVVFSEALNFDREMIVTDVGDLGLLGRQYGVADVIRPEDPGALKEAMKKRMQLSTVERTRDATKRAELGRLFNMETSVETFLADFLGKSGGR